MTIKIALIYSFKVSPWVSCQKIVANLLKAYSLVSGTVELIHLNFDDNSSSESWETTKKLLELKPDYYVFVDHRPHPLSLIEWLFELSPELKGKFLFHAYGDFTLNLQYWDKLLKLLQGCPLFIFAASERQMNLLSEFIPREFLGVCPFPVDGSEYIVNKESRSIARKQLGLSPNEVMFLYTGRLSFQKQIHVLIPEFSNWLHETGANARLVFVGEPDLLGRPYEDRHEWHGEYFHRLLKLKSNLPHEFRDRIEFHGFKSSEELKSYYLAADSFINLSLHNDEDYGMSCAEALANGLPLILSDWAGFASFSKPNYSESVTYLPVTLDEQGPHLNVKNLPNLLSEMCEVVKTHDRLSLRAQALPFFGIEAAAEIISKILGSFPDFTDANDLLEIAAYRERYFHRNTFYNHRERKYNEIYLQMYKHYV